MTGLEFASGIIDNIFSWPVAVLLIVLILRRQLAEMFRTVESFVVEAGGTKFSFNRNLERAKENLVEAQRTLPPTKPTEGDEETREEQARYLNSQLAYALSFAEDDPRSTVMEAWNRLIVEQVNKVARDMGLPPSRTVDLLKKLKSLGAVNDEIWDSIRYLNDIDVDVSAAKMEPTPDQARAYAEVARDVAEVLSRLRDGEKQSPK
jgi:hypothetical protein